MKEKTIGDVMHAGVISCIADCNVKEAMDLLDEHRIRMLVVIDGPGYLVGVVSQSDVLRAWRRGGSYEEVMGQPVRKIMSASVLTAMPHITLARAARMLTENQTHHLVVVEEHNDGRMWPIGVLSSSDIVRSVGSVEELEARTAESH